MEEEEIKKEEIKETDYNSENFRKGLYLILDGFVDNNLLVDEIVEHIQSFSICGKQ